MNRDFNDSLFHKRRYFNKPDNSYEPYKGAPDPTSEPDDWEDRPVSDAWKAAAKKKKEAEEDEKAKDMCDKEKIEKAFKKYQ